MPHAPPSPAVSMTETGVFKAAARMFCPTPLVLKSPPCPKISSIFTPSSLIRMSRPVFKTAREAYRLVRIKLASVNALSGVLTNSGHPSAKPVICSPEK